MKGRGYPIRPPSSHADISTSTIPDDAPELYDLEDDPLEIHNPAADVRYREVIQRLHKIGRSWAESHGDWVEFSREKA